MKARHEHDPTPEQIAQSHLVGLALFNELNLLARDSFSTASRNRTSFVRNMRSASDVFGAVYCQAGCGGAIGKLATGECVRLNVNDVEIYSISGGRSSSLSDLAAFRGRLPMSYMTSSRADDASGLCQRKLLPSAHL